jgi:predicted transcriptional regulator
LGGRAAPFPSKGLALVEDEINPKIVADIVKAYVSNNGVALSDLPALIRVVYATLLHLAVGKTTQPVVALKLVPAVPIKRSLAPGFVICLEDAKKFKSLKRHLMSVHGMAPAEYRAKWDLSEDYPMVAPSYAAHRSALAKGMGLGKTPRRGRRKKDLP